MPDDPNQKPKRGGYRLGSGRKPKAPTTKEVRDAEKASAPYPGASMQLHAEPEFEEGERGEDGLTIMQRAFVEAITGSCFGNATKAAIKAGYRESSARFVAAENLSKPNIQRAISHALSKMYRTPEWAKNQLFDLAGGSMANFLTVQEDGKIRVDWKKANEAGAIGQIKKISFDPNTGEPKIELYDRVKALEILLKLHGLLKDQVALQYQGEDVVLVHGAKPAEGAASGKNP